MIFSRRQSEDTGLSLSAENTHAGMVIGDGAVVAGLMHVDPFRSVIPMRIASASMTTRAGHIPSLAQIEEAIQAYTLNTAYAAYEENIKGTISVGKLADFVVLSDNLLTMDADRIKDVKVLTTVVGGKVVHEAKP